MEKENIFKWKHYQPDIILLTVRWYLRSNLSLRDLVEMMKEWEFPLAHTTIMHWVHQYGPVLNERIRKHLKSINDSWRVDETYIKRFCCKVLKKLSPFISYGYRLRTFE